MPKVTDDKLTKLLSDLGRSTLRGIRRCPKCKVYNGSRGLSCKNPACNAIFKDSGHKNKKPLEVVKLQTGSSTQIFSVRVSDKGLDHRGFVQLPLSQSLAEESDSNFFSQLSPLCFVDSCQRLFNNSILKCHEKQPLNISSCSHIQLATRCSEEAQALKIKNEAIQSLNVTEEIKESICELANGTPGPLVQRVTKNVMAVKCKVSTKHPLGYLHVSFFLTNSNKENQFVCGCTSKGKNSTMDKNCVHYYSCIAAFLSDDKCTEEFSQFILKKTNETYAIEIAPEEIDVEGNPYVAILESTIEHDVEVEVKDFILPDITQEFEGLSSVVDVAQELEENLGPTLESIISVDEDKTFKKPKTKRKSPSKKPVVVKKRAKKPSFPKEITGERSVNESNTSLSFIKWLASVTERINQTMHYQFDGKPEPLVFHAPHEFFECLISRFVSNLGVKRKRKPNFETTFTRKDAIPIGIFHNYTWHITNIAHAREMFFTPMISLVTERLFSKNSDGTFNDFNLKDIEAGLPTVEGQVPIRPVEYKTYLKIGNLPDHPDEEPSYMSIDWTPNVLPLSKIGEMKITFEYGHSRHPPGPD